MLPYDVSPCIFASVRIMAAGPAAGIGLALGQSGERDDVSPAQLCSTSFPSLSSPSLFLILAHEHDKT